MSRANPILAAALMLAAGCASVRVAKDYRDVRMEGGREPVATVEIENSGWYLFSFLPLAGGNPEKPNQVSCRWLQDTVSLENNLRILKMQEQAAGNAEVMNLTSHRSDEKYLLILLERRAYHTSAVLVKPLESKDKK